MTLDPDIFYFDNVYTFSGNCYSELIFSLIKNFDNITHNNDIQFDKSYRMTVYFKQNNTVFFPLSFPNFSKSCFSVSLSLLYATACNSLSDNVSLLLNIDYIVYHVISFHIQLQDLHFLHL